MDHHKFQRPLQSAIGNKAALKTPQLKAAFQEKLEKLRAVSMPL
jgi:hypothetical protein